MLFSVITVCFNAEKEIRKTMDSVLGQDYTDYEYLVIDGASKDGTVSVAESYLPRFEEKGITLRIISEPDRGVYDAMNKALKKAAGQFVNFMNAGDAFHDSAVLSKVAEHLMSLSPERKPDVVYGDFQKVSDGEAVTYTVQPIDRLTQNMIFCHQATFIRKSTHRKYPYDQRYGIVADYNSFLKMYRKGAEFDYLPVILADYDLSGISSRSTAKTFREIYQVRLNNRVAEKNFKNDTLFLYGYFRRRLFDDILPKKFRDWWMGRKKGKRVDKVI